MGSRSVRVERVQATREQILAAAERLFAEHGVVAVSNRQISEAAGQGNTAAVGYHFGTKIDLVRAIVGKHAADIDHIRTRMVADATGSTNVWDWVACQVRPLTEHIAALGNPSWYARFIAQVMTDPAFRAIAIADAQDSPSLQQARVGLNRCLPDLPTSIRATRGEMARQLMVHVSAERERALAEGAPSNWADWADTATGLIDGITGLLQAPITSNTKHTQPDSSRKY
ncbi:TetR family transcriptional regulator [Nocardia sp. NPDC046473]|uniref:TetR/AcrR family transcriptional regulator n=1 Tax=Nocardia sp. NPDC046473 TaxID=3155733 RepID=UPI0033CED83A